MYSPEATIAKTSSKKTVITKSMKLNRTAPFKGPSVMKLISLICVVALFVVGCNRDKLIFSDDEQERQRALKLASDLNLAINQAHDDNPRGLLKLYSIATESDSAELSQVAVEQMQRFLYTKTAFWVKTFSKLDLNVFKSNFKKMADLDEYDFTEGEITYEQFRTTVLKNLQTIKADVREKTLIEYLMRRYNK